MDVSAQHHAPAALPPVPIVQKIELVPEAVWTQWRREESLASTESNS
jgi:hypothetical protein